MKIALVGYGKMGRMIEAAAISRGNEVVCKIDPFAPGADAKDIASAARIRDADVVIEFSHPDQTVANIRRLIAMGLTVVVGTTGWSDQLNAISEEVKQAGTGLLWSSNFSLGVHLFYRVAAIAAKIFDEYPEYDVGGFEVHHNKKVDSPSGTARTLVERVLAQMTRKTTPVWDSLTHRPPAPHELHYASLRVGAVPGTHSLVFDSGADTIELTHTARSREGLASGAVVAAEWLKGRKGVFTMQDVLG